MPNVPKWKRRETQVAKDFGSVRNPLSGSNSRHSGSDTLSSKLYIEIKTRAQHAACRLFDMTAIAAAPEGKTPVVALCENGRRGYLILCRPEDLIEIALEYQKGQEE